MITSRPVATYAYTDEEKQQAKSWLSSHGYPPTRAGAEQAYQDYMDGKIDVPEADAYMGKNQKNDIEEKKNSTVKQKQKKINNLKIPIKIVQTKQENSSTEQTNKIYNICKRINNTRNNRNNNDQSDNRNKRTETTKRRKKESRKKQRKNTQPRYNRSSCSCNFALLVVLMRKRM